ncbi:IS30 family transposase, partial [Acetobacter sp. DsW_063]|uniref:IS30 family transposase n=1 Tax=Acetobacter sp. DsW_063 TaxID=1514894 RepID=UPI001177C111
RNAHRSDEIDLYGYWPVMAEHAARRRRSATMRLFCDPVLAERVLAGLSLLWSPEQICGRLRRESVRLSHETIYRWIYCRDMRERHLWKRLRRHHVKRWRRHQRRSRGLRIPPERRIARRPSDVAALQIPGHWEADLVMFRAALNGQRSVLTLVERTTRLVRIASLEGRASRASPTPYRPRRPISLPRCANPSSAIRAPNS